MWIARHQERTSEYLKAENRDLVAKKYDGSKRHGPGRPPQPAKIVKLLLKMADENPRWGYTRLRGTLRNVGFEIGLENQLIEAAPVPANTNGHVARRDRLAACSTSIIAPPRDGVVGVSAQDAGGTRRHAIDLLDSQIPSGWVSDGD